MSTMRNTPEDPSERGPSPSGAPTSLVLVRNADDGTVVLQYVRGEQIHADGSPASLEQPVALPSPPDRRADRRVAPSAVRFPVDDRLYVARAVHDANGGTTLCVVVSGYATMLAESTPVVAAVRPTIIDSGVTITHVAGELLLVWREGQALLVMSSRDGATWSNVETLGAAPDGPFALWSGGDVLYLVDAPTGASAIRLRTSRDGRSFGPPATIVQPPPAHGPVVGVTVAAQGSRVVVAYATSTAIRVVGGDEGGAAFAPPVTVLEVPGGDPQHSLRAVAVHPSPYGWALLYTTSLVTPDGQQYALFGRRSDDGLAYGATTWSFGSTREDPGIPGLATTPTPMPWIVKECSSDRDAGFAYNFIITGEGFTHAEKDTFLTAAKALAANIADRAPFFYNRELYNVWIVCTFSKQSGADREQSTDDRDTIFDAYRHDRVTLISRKNPIDHARRVVPDATRAKGFYGFVIFNPRPGETVGTPPTDMTGVPLAPVAVSTLTAIHEYLHTSTGRFALGDHERRNQIQTVNKSFESTLSRASKHAWQRWFTFEGPAPSRLIRVTPAYRQGLREWFAAHDHSPESTWEYDVTHFAFAEDPTSPYYVDALSLWNVSLWESEMSDVADLDANQQFAPLRACCMYSKYHHGRLFCPVCSEKILSCLHEAAGSVFEADAFQAASGAYLEFEVPAGPAGWTRLELPKGSLPDLAGLVAVNGRDVPRQAFSCSRSLDVGVEYWIARVDLSPWIGEGQVARIVFKKQPLRRPRPAAAPAGGLLLRIPGLQVVNGRGARYSLQPVGRQVIQKLRTMRARAADPDGYEFWDLAAGALAFTFTPNPRDQRKAAGRTASDRSP